MLLRKSLLVCLPVLALTACGTSKDDKKTAATATTYGNNETTPPTTTPETPTNPTTPTDPVVVPPGDGKGGQPTGDQNQNQNTPVTHECETLVIDFERGAKGQELDGQYSADPFGVTFLAHRSFTNAEQISNVRPVAVQTPQTGLGAMTGGTVYDNGGYIKLFFKYDTSVISLDMINVENNTSTIELFTDAGQGQYASKSVQQIAQRAKNETFNLSVDDHSYVRKMAIKLSGPSMVDNIKICVKK